MSKELPAFIPQQPHHPDKERTEATRTNPVASWVIGEGCGIPVRLDVKYVDLDPGKMTGLGRLFSIGLTPALCRLLAQHLLEAAEGNLGGTYPHPS